MTSVDIEEAVGRMRAWGEARDWKGYDPYDALNSPAARLLTAGTRTGRRALTQAVKLSPVNLRPLLGVRPEWNAKALGLVASAYARLAAAGDETARAPAGRWLDWLESNAVGDSGALGWGYNFDVQTRFFAYRRGTPNAIATSFVGHAFLDGVELLADARRRQPALAAARFLERHMRSGAHFGYLRGEPELVHNANLLACALLVRTARLLGEESLLESVRGPLDVSLRAQREDGSWPYAAGSGGDWVDNFHTAYVLESLAHCEPAYPEVRANLERGLAYWDRELFLPDGTPKYHPDRVYPLDAHCYASAIDAWLAVAAWHPGAAGRAERLAELLLRRMLDREGFVEFQQRRLWTSRVPYVRWTTAPSFRALGGLLLQRHRAERAHAAQEHAHTRLD